MDNHGQQAIDHALKIAGAGHRVGMHTGAIHGAHGGRTDNIPLTVPSNSYVIPADVVSSFPGAEGNTMAGMKYLDAFFRAAPYNSPDTPYAKARTNTYGTTPQKGEGPVADRGDKGVDIIAAGGEYVVTPEQVQKIGDGDMKLGHKVLDQIVKQVREKNVKTLSNLPGPVKNPFK